MADAGQDRRGPAGVGDRHAVDSGGQLGAQQIFDPRTKKKRFKPRTPVTVVAGPPIDLSRWADAAPSSAVLAEITNEIMNTLRAMIGEVRGAEPPPLWVPTPPTPAPTPAPTQEPK